MSDDTVKARTPFGRRLNDQAFAVLVIRLLGVYLLIGAFASSLLEVNWILFHSSTFGSGELLTWMTALGSARVVPLFIIGIYLVVGGQWVFDRVSVPIARRPMRRAAAETEETRKAGPSSTQKGSTE